MAPRVWLGVRKMKAPAWPPTYQRKLSLARSWAAALVALMAVRSANKEMLRLSRLIAPVSLESAAHAVELRRGRWKSRGLRKVPRWELTCFQIRLWEPAGRRMRPAFNRGGARRGPARQMSRSWRPTFWNAASA